ncbi:MAG: hypothetical protein AB1679_01580 [Actinomycetota bacterium]|jgi:hypothetical protein
MDATHNLFRSLDVEWTRLGGTAAARAALARWATQEPVLADLDDPAAVVEVCRRHKDPERCNAVVGALLRLADDDLAARTLLQALLPGLLTRAARGTWLARPTSQCSTLWDGPEELGQELVAELWQRIRTLAGTSPRFPACALVEGAWRRVRQRSETARARCTVPLSEVGPAASEARPGRSTAEALTVCLVDAVRRQRLGPTQAGLVYTTRVLGHPTSVLVGPFGPDRQAVRARRARVERKLAAG